MSRILFCTSGYFPDQSGGAEHQARLQAEELTRRGHRVRVVCPRRYGQRTGYVSGIPVTRLPRIDRPYLGELSYCFFLFFFLLWRMPRQQIVHIHMTHLDSVITCVVAWIFRKPVYAKIARGGRTGDAQYLDRAWYLRRIALKYPARFQVISEEIRQDLRSLGVSEDRLVRIPNGVLIPEASTAEARMAARARLGLSPDAVVVLYLGRFTAIKGLGTLLAAWELVPTRAAMLVLVGRRWFDAPLGSDAPGARPAPTGQNPVLEFDWTNDPDAWATAADIFVLPSRGEGMSNALLRAMASGLAVVATPVGAAETMIEDGVSGLLVPVDDHQALAAALERVIDDAPWRRSLGLAARERVAAEYSIESVVSRIEAEYRQLLQRGRTTMPVRE